MHAELVSKGGNTVCAANQITNFQLVILSVAFVVIPIKYPIQSRVHV